MPVTSCTKNVHVLLVLVIAATLLHDTLSQGLSAGLGHECWSIKVLSVLRQHLEVDEVCELVPDHGTVHEDVVLLLH